MSKKKSQHLIASRRTVVIDNHILESLVLGYARSAGYNNPSIKEYKQGKVFIGMGTNRECIDGIEKIIVEVD